MNGDQLQLIDAPVFHRDSSVNECEHKTLLITSAEELMFVLRHRDASETFQLVSFIFVGQTTEDELIKSEESDGFSFNNQT